MRFTLDRKFCVKGNENLNKLLSPFLLKYSKITLVIKTAEKNEHIIPIIRVTANPFTGPCPRLYKIKPTKKVVKLASIIDV